MKKLIGQGLDDHPRDEEDKAPSAWSVAVLDDCAGCGDIRIELTMEEVGRAGYGEVAHLSPAGARQLRQALTKALSEIGERD